MKPKGELQWVLVVAAVYFGVGIALWYYNRAKDPRFPVGYPSKLKWALEWPTKQWAS